MQFCRLFITGAGGYVGSALVPALLARGYDVVAFDLFLYGDVLRPHPRLTQVKGDIRDAALMQKASAGCDAVVHLACISNDPSFDLDPALGRAINYDAFRNVIDACDKNAVRRLIVASSTSQYGVKPAHVDVTEDIQAEPITDYARFKIACEQLLLEASPSSLEFVFVRPATLCGYAPRLRLDLSVNILTIHALVEQRIKVFGGDQMRPALHIADMVRFYELMLEAPAAKIHREAFNVSYGNLTILQIAQLVKDTLGDERVTLEVTPSTDPRSYRVNTDKAARVLGFTCAHDLSAAVLSLRDAWQAGKLADPLENPMYYNIKRMKQVELK
ncbi:MAG: NAD(P)-dependent oxidoreductase [Deltaproteobacteria bacterium]|nr:NAD(P)-dependent oxidoreductase [Deltaproteobacteria bacterium]